MMIDYAMHVAAERWRTSSGFMVGRQFRLGPLYRAMGCVAELAIGMAASSFPAGEPEVAGTHSIFVLRNNDIGDLLVTTPLFQALRQRFARATIVVGVGGWNEPLLENNPYVDEVVRVDGPWFNTALQRRSIADALRYVYRSVQARQLRRRRFDVGIDVLGSHWGSLLLLRGGIPCRVGVRGYAGGHAGRTHHVDHDPTCHVAREVIKLAEVLAPGPIPDTRPQLFLTQAERMEAETAWRRISGDGRLGRRVILAPGGKPEKIWPEKMWRELAGRLANYADLRIGIVGGPQDVAVGRRLAAAAPQAAFWAGQFSLRQTLSIVQTADAVVCNDSMMTHVAAAFTKPCVVLLGPAYTDPEAHARVWGYGPPCKMLGRPGTEAVTTDEAIVALRSLLDNN